MLKIRWGILGTASIAEKQIIPAIRQSGNGELVAVASRSPEKAKKFALRHEIPVCHGSYEALLADASIDAIYNPLPTGMHTQWNLACAQAGKPVLCEKPFAVTESEARLVFKTFADARLPVMEASMFQYHPLTRKVMELIGSGAIGTPVTLRSTFNTSIATQDFRFKPNMGGGALLDLGYYCVALARLVAGEKPSRSAGVVDWHIPGDVDRTGAGTLLFDSGLCSYFACSMSSAFNCSYEILGTAGRLRVERGGMVAWPGEAFAIQLWQGEKQSEIMVDAANPYALMVEDFGRALSGDSLLVSPESTIDTIATIEQLRRMAL